MKKIIFTLSLDKIQNRNPYAISALMRKAGKMKLKIQKRNGNPRNKDYLKDYY